MIAPFILFDGKFYKTDEQIFQLRSMESLLFVESVRSIRNQFVFWEDHISIIDLQFQLFRLQKPPFLKNEAKDFKRQLERMLVKNKLYKSARIDIYFFCDKGRISYAVKAEPIDAISYGFNEDGVMLELFPRIKKAISPVSGLRIGSESYWQFMQSSSPEKEYLLQNTDGCVLETPGRNLYVIMGEKVITASPETGAYINPAKRIVQKIVENSRLQFVETTRLSKDDLLSANEVFLSDDISGISWVKAFGYKRYYSNVSREIAILFSKLL